MNTSKATTPRKSTPFRIPPKEQDVINHAISLLERRIFQRGDSLEDPGAVSQFLRLKLASCKHEAFAMIFVDSQHRVIAFEELFKGTIDSTTVHARVVIQRALHYNAAVAFLAHNHPSGKTEPSAADRLLTNSLKALLAHIDVRVLDHFIVGQGEPFSFANAGLL
ncbi:JAB domain-containing protein [Burkholderia sp. F1]|uniref:JAB domain-containing protein n=1 Tax=Burkholderia sp. F1 TaxID=3366817 RepID=UPI003D74FD47